MDNKALPTIQIDNDQLRVTEWRFQKEAATGFHRHEYDYVIVPLTTGALKIIDAEGKESLAQLTAGQSYFRKAGVKHDVINAHDGAFAFIEIELKTG